MTLWRHKESRWEDGIEWEANIKRFNVDLMRRSNMMMMIGV